MYIICQNCNTNFIVDPNQIGNEGRRVKCSQCEYVWFFKPKESEFKKEEAKLSDEISDNLTEQAKYNDEVKFNKVTTDRENLSTGVNLPVRVMNQKSTDSFQQLILNLLTAFLLVSNIGITYFLFNYNKYFHQNRVLNKVIFHDFTFISDNETKKFVIQYQLSNHSAKKQIYVPIINVQLFDKNNKIITSHIDKANLKLVNNKYLKMNTEFHKINEEVAYVNITLGNKFYFFIKNFLSNMVRR